MKIQETQATKHILENLNRNVIINHFIEDKGLDNLLNEIYEEFEKDKSYEPQTKIKSLKDYYEVELLQKDDFEHIEKAVEKNIKGLIRDNQYKFFVITDFDMTCNEISSDDKCFYNSYQVNFYTKDKTNTLTLTIK